MKQTKLIEKKKEQKKLFLKYEELENLNDEELVYINTSFLYYIVGYYQLIDKYTIDISSIINNIFNINQMYHQYLDPTYSKILVKDIKKLLKYIPESSIRHSTLRKIDNNKKMTSQEAYNLLTKDVINNKNDLFKEENKWILHSLYVGMAAGRIAARLNLDSNHARALGYIHDIGRKIDHNNHSIEGFKYMLNNNFLEEAKTCLTHSFINNDINLTAGGGPKNPKIYKLINNFLKQNPPTIYDNIIQLCDLFCLETGFTTIEKRILDLANRKGVYDNSKEHFAKTMELKEKIETAMGCNLYCLFPDISPDDINNIEKNREELNKLFNENVKKYIVK